MAWRKWIVRGIVYGIVGAAAAGALLYQRWTNPAAVREQVIAALSKTFPGAQVSIDSARLRLFGGIQVNGLRFARFDDAQKYEFLHVPSAIFYHDKEKILDGELALRKIELTRPRLRVSRARDGTLNLKDLLRKPSGSPLTRMPAIVIHHGTIILEDRDDQAKASLVEINDVSLTLVNDPIPTVTMRGAANSSLLGNLTVEGTLDRRTTEVVVSFRAWQLPLTHSLLAKLPVQCPPGLFDGLQLSAQAKIDGRISYHPSQPQPFYHDVRCEITGGKLQHPKLPLPLEKLDVTLHCLNGTLHLEKLTAHSGVTRIAAHGVAQLPNVDQEYELHLDLHHVGLCEELATGLPDRLEKLRELYKRFQPNGPVSIHIACARHDGEWVALNSGEPSRVSLRPEKLSLAFRDFAYPLVQATGYVDYNLLNKHVNVKLMAYAGDRPVVLSGHWNGEGPQADVKFDCYGTDIVIDEKLLRALPIKMQPFAESFHAAGKVDFRAQIRHEPGKEYRNEYQVYFHDATLCWDLFPYRLQQVSGYLSIYPEQYWEFHEFQGTHNGGHVLLHGKSIPRVDAKGDKTYGISMEITGRKIALDADLHNALRPMPNLYKSWETFRPHGDLYFTAVVNRHSAEEIDVKVDARGCSVKPTFFAFEIQDVSGLFHYHNHNLEIAKLNARHDQAFIKLGSGKVNLPSRGGYYADFADVEIRGLVLDDEFINALPPKLCDAAKKLNLRDPLKVKTRAVIYQPPETGTPFDVYWDGQVWMYGAKLTTGLEFTNVTGTAACVGRYNGRQIVGVDGNVLLEQATLYDQPFKNVHAKFQMRESSPDILLVGLRAPIFGGDIAGQMRVDFNSALRYEMNLTASQINVAEFGRQNLGPKSQITGTANARLYLTGLGAGMETLDGNGSIDIPRGHLYNLPFLLDLLKFLGLHWPDRTAFEEFHAAYSIQGSKVHVQRLDLLGSAVSLSGKGDFDIQSKNLQLEVYPMWGRIEQLLPSAIRPLPTTFSKNLLTVDVRGKVSSNPKDLRFTMKPVPVIIDPLLLLRDRMLGQPDNSGNNVGLSLPTNHGALTQPRSLIPTSFELERPRWFRIWD